ncbi:MAG: hypothetical protein ABIQ18_39690 [Umezawaea sp.]
MTELHWHGYVWNNLGSEISDSKGRDELPDFRTLEHPANRLAACLKKSPSLVRGTFTDVDAALMWFATEYRKLPRMLRDDQVGQLGSPDDEDRLARQRESLLRGTDVAWSFWIVNVRRVDINLIACPSKQAPGFPCPKPATAAR